MKIEMPTGDPYAIRAAGDALCQLATQIMNAANGVETAIGTAVQKWESTRSEMVVTAAVPSTMASATAARELETVGQVLKDYGRALEDAQTNAAFATYHRLTAELASAQSHNDPDQNLLSQKHQAAKTNATQALTDLADKESRTATVLYEAVGRFNVPEVSPTAQEVLQYVVKLGSTVKEKTEPYKNVKDVITLAQAPLQFKRGITAREAWKEFNRSRKTVQETVEWNKGISKHLEKVFGKNSPKTIQGWIDANDKLIEDTDDLLKKGDSAREARIAFLDSLRPVGRSLESLQ